MQGGQYISQNEKATPAHTMANSIPPAAPPRHWLILDAWAPELDAFKAALPTLRRDRSRTFSVAEIGVGLVAAAVGATLAIAKAKPDAVILIGTAGWLKGKDRAPMLGTAHVIDKAAIPPDLSNGIHAYLPDLIHAELRCDPGLTRLFLQDSHHPLSVVCPLGITKSRVAARNLLRSTNAQLENLEAYAVLLAAQAARIPSTAILGIANHVGPEGHQQWKKYGQQAAAAACDLAVNAFMGMPGSRAIKAKNR